MSPSVHTIFPIPIFNLILDLESELIQSDLDLIQTKLKQNDVLENNVNNLVTKDCFILDEWNLSEIKKCLDNYLQLFAVDILGYEYDNLYITQSWINVNPPGTLHHPHNHPNSILSGILYVSAPEKGGNIVFHRQPRQIVPKIKFNEENDFTWENSYIIPENNQLLIFPSYLQHSVSKNLNLEEDRVSLSFNTFMTPLGVKSNKTFATVQ